MYYKMNLCRPKNLENAMKSDRYYTCKNGVFQTDSIDVVDQLIVNESFFNRRFVKENMTHIDFPLLRMYIGCMDRRYFYSLEGIEDAPLFLFYIDDGKLNIPENKAFHKEKVTEEDRNAYIVRHSLLAWKEILLGYQSYAIHEKARVLSQKITK